MSEQRSQHSDDEADYLLSAGRLSRAQRDRIFAAVEQASRPPARWPRAGLRTGIIGVAAVAAVVCLVVWPRTPIDSGAFGDKGGTRSRTTTSPTSGATDVACDVTCLRGTLAACARGSILAFSARGVSAEMFMTSYLQPTTGGARVWLIENEPVSAAAAGGNGLLPRGARLPDDLNAGTYAIDLLVTSRPLSRVEATELPAAGAVARARFEATVPP